MLGLFKSAIRVVRMVDKNNGMALEKSDIEHNCVLAVWDSPDLIINGLVRISQ